ncbi:amino acid permease [Nocardioides luteus]|uniref:L-asparagine permease n=1 Tax=Nocardioides luteus TaxID=1844 RepID=A0A1J4N861_9ACTN|nr:amino acid permease [Nocardioides luteus]OIJ27700.1 L-asparagine permease [Nocardioides luteus]
MTLPSSTGTEAPPQITDAGDDGYGKSLTPRHITMIAIGGAIGTGLFLGAGGRLASAGPSLAIAYAACGLVAFIVVRCLGELILYRPSSGAFVSYAREFLGEKGAYTAGWMYFLNWSTTGIADITAIALYAHYWSFFAPVPQWVLALGALVIVLTLNLLSVRLFGEMEFWFALIKVATLVVFMAIAIFLIVTRHPIDGTTPGPQLILDHGGMFPSGVLPMVLVVQGVIFAYASIELVGVAAGETADPRRVMPRAINTIIWRIGIFYVGSVVLLAMLLPWSSYSADESPFVTVLSRVGVSGAGDVMNLVVLTAAMSSLNSGLYSTGRILRSLAAAGTAPRFAAAMNRHKVPYGGILMTAAVCVLGVGLNYVVPAQAFEIVLNLASVGIIATWAIILISHTLFVRRSRAGEVERPSFRVPRSPFPQLVALAFLALVLILMFFDHVGRITLLAMPVLLVLLVGGWFLVRDRIDTSAMEV